jgi:outer membrane immunogenic protein
MVSKFMNLAGGNAMKKLLLGTAMSMAMVASATAADLFVKAPPPPAPVWSWTGCYVGGNVGGGFSRIVTTDNAIPPNDTGTQYNPGVVGGGQVGCDVQVDQHWVFGVAGEFEAANIAGSAVIPGTTFPIESRIRWLGTVTGRVGFLFFPTTMAYVRGGGAWSRDNLEIDIPPPPLSTATDNRSGWTVGGGLEQRFWSNVSGFVEYNYLDFGRRTLQFAPVSPHIISERVQEVLVGLNFRFGGAPGPTRY